MRKKLTAVLTTLIILIVIYGIFFIYLSLSTKQTPIAVDGVLDLTAWRFSDEDVIPLDGQWEFYPDKLLYYDNTLHSPYEQEHAERITVPGSWASQMPALGKASYRLQINVNDDTSVYGLKTSSIQISNRILVNGKEIGASGHAANKGSDYALNKPYVSYFNLQMGWNEIVVEVANYHFSASSGINESIYFGHAKQISELRNSALIHDWITFTAYLIMGMYFIGLYSQRKDDHSLLVLGVICILISLFTSSRGERILLDILGDLPFWLFYRIQLMSAITIGMGFFLYTYTAFRMFSSVWMSRIGFISGAIASVWLIGFLPFITTDFFRQWTTIYSTFSLLYAIYVFVHAALHKVDGSRYLIVAALALNTQALVQNLNIYFGVPIYSTVPFEPFLFLLMLALLMSLRFSNEYRKMKELSTQLLKVDKLKDEFLARTSHEFKTPLHGVMNIATSMLDDSNLQLTAEQQEKLQLITNITGRLSKLVYDILDFSKLKQGDVTIDPIQIDVHNAVDMHMRMYAYLCVDRNIRLINLIPKQFPYALADEIRFSQIISNLLDNAVKYTENGSITVTAGTRDDMIIISVQDTGEGIEPHNIPHLYEPFQSFDTTMQRQGFGLGLSITKQLVELQHGELSVSSTRGIGTTFTFTLPIMERNLDTDINPQGNQSNEPRSEYVLPTPYYLQQKGTFTVMIVDDQALNLKVLLDALKPLGYNMIAVKNGYEALEQMGNPHSIDLVILDLMMPGMSGYEVCKEIRKNYTILELPVLMVTAAIQPHEKVAAFEAGANDFLPKPFDSSELKARIGSLLAMKESLSRAVDLEVAFLQSQIKPHFLYNVLNSIVASSYTDVERSRQLTVNLADYLRGSFRFSHTENRIVFSEEFSLIRTYVDIEQARFKDRIRFQYDIADVIYSVPIPPLLFQPLVENAIRHGIGDRVEGGTVTITATAELDEYRFVIADDGVGIEHGLLSKLLESGSERQRGVGLLNINKRIKYGYGTQLQIESELGKGTKVTVRIPIPLAE